MTSIILSACVLLALTVVVHTAGIAVLLRHLTTLYALTPKSLWPVIRRLLRIIWWLILLHLAQISIWGLFYLWRGFLPNAEAAFYFSGVTYTSLGYGDIVLAKPWRLLAPIEGLVGVMMCGLSTGYFFVVVSRIHQWKPINAAEVPISEET
jgi:Ion channel